MRACPVTLSHAHIGSIGPCKPVQGALHINYRCIRRGVNTDGAAKFFAKQVYIEKLKNTHHIITLEFNTCIKAYFPP